jgi:hypothetical protein
MGSIVRGKIIRDDVALFDGVNKTATRVDATSGTITGLQVNDHVDVLQVFGGGTAYTVGTIEAARRFIGSASVCVMFSPGTWTIDSDVTLPATMSAHISAGCVFSVSSGITLTFSGPVYVQHSTWFSGDGTVEHLVGADGFPGY